MIDYDPFDDIETLRPPTPWQVVRYLLTLIVFLSIAFGALVWSLCRGMF